MNLELNLDFAQAFTAQNFFFGVATAPYLSEGGYNYADGMKNNYGPLELNGKWEPSGEATRFWTNYEEHIKLAASLGLNAFRMGLEWARIQPSSSLEAHDPPAWDWSAVDHYAEIVGTLFKYEMQPIITLHHFTFPAWLGQDFWLTDSGVDLLMEWELKIVEEVNERLLRNAGRVMDHFLVYNEPNLMPMWYAYGDANRAAAFGPEPARTVYDNMWSRYVKIYDGLHDLFERKGWPVPQVGFTVASQCIYEFDKMGFDLVRLRTFGVDRANADRQVAVYRSAWLKRMDALARSKLTDAQYARFVSLTELGAQTAKPSLLPKTLDALYSSPRTRKLDYLSINVYEPLGGPKGGTKWWEMAADGEVYRTFIQATNEFNTDLPFYMGENSLVYKQVIGEPAEPRPDGWTRERFLKTYFMEMIRCMKEGVPIRGYLWWSLLDDYEWNEGHPPRLGLFNYDYVNHKIHETDGLGEPAGRIYAYLIAALRSGDKETIARAFTLKYRE